MAAGDNGREQFRAAQLDYIRQDQLEQVIRRRQRDSARETQQMVQGLISIPVLGPIIAVIQKLISILFTSIVIFLIVTAVMNRYFPKQYAVVDHAVHNILQPQIAPQMSASVSATFDVWLQEAYLNCWVPPSAMPEGAKYVTQVRVSFNPDGSLSMLPALLNPPSDPAWRAYAESAVRAVMKCNPLHVPSQYVPYFEQWRSKTVHFSP